MKNDIESRLLHNFGFSVKEIAEFLNTTQKAVRLSINNDSVSKKVDELGINLSKAQIAKLGTRGLRRLARNGGKMFDIYSYKRAEDKTVPFLELLLSFNKAEIKRFNRRLRKWGNVDLAEYYRVKISIIRAIKQFFGYYTDEIPLDYHDKIHYLPFLGREEVKKRDEMRCIRCERKRDDYKFFKIKHPGPNIADNYALICDICRKNLMAKDKTNYYNDNQQENLDEFRKFIKNN